MVITTAAQTCVRLWPLGLERWELRLGLEGWEVRHARVWIFWICRGSLSRLQCPLQQRNLVDSDSKGIQPRASRAVGYPGSCDGDL